MNDWVVGVDAGGSRVRTVALCLGTGEQLGRVVEQGANWTVCGREACQRLVRAAVTAVLPSGAAPAALCVGFAGYYPPDHEVEATAALAREWGTIPVRVVTDLETAWSGAFLGAPGMVAIAGTGSVAFGRGANGRSARAGGWGPLLGDDGSAYAVALTALRELAERLDRGEPDSELGRSLLASKPELGQSLGEWLRGIYRSSWGRSEIAGLAPIICAAVEADPIAGSAIRSQARRLRAQIEIVRDRIGEPELPVALTGGLALGCAAFRHEVAAGEDRPKLPLAAPAAEACWGAVLLAAEALGGREAHRAAVGHAGAASVHARA